MTIPEFFIVAICSIVATVIYKYAQLVYIPLWHKVGLQPFLFFVASVAIGFFFGWLLGVIFFLVYFPVNLVVMGITMEVQMNRLMNYHTGRDASFWPETDEDDSSSYDNNPNIFYCPKCGERNDTKNQFNLSEKRICQSCLTVFK